MKQVFVIALLICSPLLFAQQNWNLQRGVEAFDNKRYEEALPFLQSAAKAGEAKAQYLLGQMYNYGLGVTASAQISLNMYNKAIAQNYFDAIWGLAAAYSNGKGAVSENQNNTSALLKKLADGGHSVSQYLIGERYRYGFGLPKEPKLAIQYYQMALQNGYKKAAEDLSCMYSAGKGIEVDEKAAFRYLDMLGEERSGIGTYRLGEMYYRGFGVKADTIKAEQLLKSIDKKDEFATKFAAGLLPEVQEAASQIRFRANMQLHYKLAEIGCVHYEASGKFCQFQKEGKVPFISPFFLQCSTFSIAFWIKDFPSGDVVTANKKGTDSEYLKTSVVDDKILLYDTFQYSLSALKDGQWHLITITIDNGNLKLYVDGREVESKSIFPNKKSGEVIWHVNEDMPLCYLRLYQGNTLSSSDIRAIYEHEKNIIN